MVGPHCTRASACRPSPWYSVQFPGTPRTPRGDCVPLTPALRDSGTPGPGGDCVPLTPALVESRRLMAIAVESRVLANKEDALERARALLPGIRERAAETERL